MRASSDHILTSHVGSLPRPDDLIAANRARETGEAPGEHDFWETLRAAVAAVVRRQRDLGIDVPGDGESANQWDTASTTEHGGIMRSTVWAASSSAGRVWTPGRRGNPDRGRSC